MEFLVTMTTHVPEGTPKGAIDDVRDREAVHSRELAAQGHLLRLWRPPLEPGEWRSLGLFAAMDNHHLEEVLASMPLRVWRTDEVTPLSPHPNDPAHMSVGPGMEFLIYFTISIPEGDTRPGVGEAETHEAALAMVLVAQGHLERLWVLPGYGRALGLWRAADDTELGSILKSLPLDPGTTIKTMQVASHPSDPLVTGQ